MNEQQMTLAQNCLTAAATGAMSFPEIVGALMQGGFESYTIDYRRGSATYYQPRGESVVLDMEEWDLPVGSAFDVAPIKAAILKAQTNAPGYTYKDFSETVTAAGCAGYMVSFSGRRVVYFGRTAETHVEHFPSAPKE